MPDQAQTLPSTKTRIFRWVIILFLVLAVLIAGAVVSLMVGSRSSFDRAMKEARALGYPLTYEEIAKARHTWPPEQDGAAAFLRLADRLAEIAKSPELDALPVVGKAELPPLGHLWAPDTQAAVEAALTPLAPELAHLDDLVTYPGASWPFTVTADPMDMLSPNLAELRLAARLKYLQTISTSMQGSPKVLPERIATIIRLGDLLSDHPSIISALVKAGCDDYAVTILEQALALGDVSPDQLTELGIAFAKAESCDSIPNALLAERALFLAVGNRVLAGISSSAAWIPPTEIPLLTRFDLAFGLRKHNRLIAVSNDPKRRLTVSRNLDKERESTPSYYLLSSVLFPSLSRAMELDLIHTARLRSAAVGVAVEQFRVQSGRFPEQLTECVPRYLKGIPQDPFVDAPLLYKRTSEGVVIYSVGENAKDDGGEVLNPKKNEFNRDCGLRLLNPELRRRPPVAPATQTSPESAPG